MSARATMTHAATTATAAIAPLADASVPHVTVCICTYRRPALLQRLLAALEQQNTNGAFTYSIVVADNDATQSGRAVATSFAAASPVAAQYCAEPEQNIALARNRAIAAARGEYIAFLDDDEFPVADWLHLMVETCERSHAAGVLGPVRPYFDDPPPQWVVKGGFCNRPEHPTGTVMPWSKSRTGNLLFRRNLLDGISEPFRRQFGTGGEDVDFFQRMASAGHVFVWCNEAIAYEVVPPARCTRRYMLSRALLRGRNSLKLSRGRTGLIGLSIIALPLYSVALPVAAVAGQHVFMKYCIRFCDHLGRVLAAVGLNPVSQRPV